MASRAKLRALVEAKRRESEQSPWESFLEWSGARSMGQALSEVVDTVCGSEFWIDALGIDGGQPLLTADQDPGAPLESQKTADWSWELNIYFLEKPPGQEEEDQATTWKLADFLDTTKSKTELREQARHKWKNRNESLDLYTGKGSIPPGSRGAPQVKVVRTVHEHEHPPLPPFVASPEEKAARREFRKQIRESVASLGQSQTSAGSFSSNGSGSESDSGSESGSGSRSGSETTASSLFDEAGENSKSRRRSTQRKRSMAGGQSKLRSLFDQLDTGNRGRLSKDQMRKLTKGLALQLTNEEYNDLFSELQNSRGELDFDGVSKLVASASDLIRQKEK
uniref:Uncharacterized protein n=1 Tax=Rhizochromulina marina TaxID=1034831 RepID=A0A7S2SR28_9STRA